ncbi:MAG: phenylalanine--tRNA ligase subunit beta [Bacteroidetes bacterium]|nr:phenylalanine--tRNA ligase subunit beta [Bacteroidota bacterium]
MKISINWLKDFIKIAEEPKIIAATLNSLGLEVENIEYQSEKYKNIFSAKVLSVEDHPNANKLKLCTVDVGSKIGKLKIICGDTKVSASQKVVVALVGATIPRNQHDPLEKPFTLTKATIRGVESNGMICSKFELDLSDDKDSIYVLQDSTTIGQNFSDFLNYNDIIFDIALTPNRGDCLNHFGIARELAAKLNKKLTLPIILINENISKEKIKFKIEINSNNCPLYLARIISDVKIQESPDWLKTRLSSIGIRSINNIVDVTNYVMHEIGQPLHAFDLDKISGSKIIVKDSKKGEKFKTLDDKTHNLNDGTIMICDSNQSVAIGGIMGGSYSEISRSTKNILLEAAIFNSTSIRKSSKYLGIQTDAATRFERGIDNSKIIWALNRASQLIALTSNGKIVSEIYASGKSKNSNKSITLTFEKLNSYLGFEIPKVKVKKYLNSLELKVLSFTKDKIECSIPSHRNDIEQDVDLIEEISRIHGYDFIPSSNEVHYHFSNFQNKDEEVINGLKNYFTSIGLNEICTNSFIKQKVAKKFGSNFVKVDNPISTDLEILKSNLIPTMLEIISLNKNKGTNDLQLFEIGTVYEKSESYKTGNNILDYKESQQLLIAFTGNCQNKTWYQSERNFDLFDIKGIVDQISPKYLGEKVNYLESNKSEVNSVIFTINLGNVCFGKIGVISKNILNDFGLIDDVFYAEIDLEKFLKLTEKYIKKYTPIPRFPGIKRDLAILIPNNLNYNYIKEIINKYSNELLEHHEIFDLYSSNEFGKGVKSIGISLFYQSLERTLTEQEVDLNVNKIINKLESNNDITVRRKTN